MPPKMRELKSMLRKAGFVSEPGKGSHTKWAHPRHREIHVTLSGGDGEDARRYQVQEVDEALQSVDEREGRQND
jgi:predicted RNA binding protein YcfA (HicA-like mRNA interferase family)